MGAQPDLYRQWMLGPALHRLGAITALALTTACSFGLTQAPKRIADPTQPIACSDSAVSPFLDLLGFTAAGGVVVVEDSFRREGFGGAGAVEVMAVGVAAVYGMAAMRGAHEVNRCSAARDLNARCRGGDAQACVTLSPDWRPTPAPPPSPPATPAAAWDGPPSEAR